VPELDTAEGEEVSRTMPSLDHMIDPAMAEHRLWRVWRYGAQGQPCTQPVTEPLPQWWALPGASDYVLVLARDTDDALGQGLHLHDTRPLGP
jgi:hypothetical protein